MLRRVPMLSSHEVSGRSQLDDPTEGGLDGANTDHQSLLFAMNGAMVRLRNDGEI